MLTHEADGHGPHGGRPHRPSGRDEDADAALTSAGRLATTAPVLLAGNLQF